MSDQKCPGIHGNTCGKDLEWEDGLIHSKLCKQCFGELMRSRSDQNIKKHCFELNEVQMSNIRAMFLDNLDTNLRHMVLKEFVHQMEVATKLGPVGLSHLESIMPCGCSLKFLAEWMIKEIGRSNAQQEKNHSEVWAYIKEQFPAIDTDANVYNLNFSKGVVEFKHRKETEKEA